MTSRRSWWLAVIESYPCPACGAAPGARCITISGEDKTEPHADRARAGDRCARCGSQLHADGESELCDRCQLVRSLEVERATTWRRLHP